MRLVIFFQKSVLFPVRNGEGTIVLDRIIMVIFRGLSTSLARCCYPRLMASLVTFTAHTKIKIVDETPTLIFINTL